jgi:hypothetical protein
MALFLLTPPGGAGLAACRSMRVLGNMLHRRR